MSRLDCERVRAAASAHRDRKLPAAEAAGIDAHLRGCPACRELFARDGRIAALARSNHGPREVDTHAVARKVRRGLVEGALRESRRPAWQRQLRRLGRLTHPHLARVVRSRVTAVAAILLALALAYEAGRRGATAPNPTPPRTVIGGGDEDLSLERGDRRGLPALQRLLQDFDAEDHFLERLSRTTPPPSLSPNPPRNAEAVPGIPASPPEVSLEGFDPGGFRLVSARRHASPRALHAPEEIETFLRALTTEAAFDVVIEALVINDGRRRTLRLRRKAGGRLEILSPAPDDRIRGD